MFSSLTGINTENHHFKDFARDMTVLFSFFIKGLNQPFFLEVLSIIRKVFPTSNLVFTSILMLHFENLIMCTFPF